MTALRDVALIARFEILRAVRTWQALAVVVMYLVATTGASYIFVQILGEMEGAIAGALGVQRTAVPGAMLGRLVVNEDFRNMIGAMIGDERLVDTVLRLPVLAIFHQWIGLIFVPYLATFVSAEAISTDLRTRALRFELLRTGRLELVLGRYAGQAVLCAVAAALSAVGTGVIGMFYMTGNEPLALAEGLAITTFRAWLYGLPFIGIGMMCSQLTASPAWARVLAVLATSFTWIGFGLARWAGRTEYGWLTGPFLPLFPEAWIRLLWEGGASTAIAGVFFVAQGITLVAAGNAWLSRRDA